MRLVAEEADAEPQSGKLTYKLLYMCNMYIAHLQLLPSHAVMHYTRTRDEEVRSVQRAGT